MEKKGIGCAIEAEPKTLMGGELVSAREAAKVIIESKGAEEASAIFTAMVSPFEVVQLRFSSGSMASMARAGRNCSSINGVMR
ncbi:unnamed protein product [Spirodela intermedia]|uniref:Uncharacterized protein n=1 Tax=Spirodela intermedia TaxID=51605 RepID=A0A7I8J738_SPIIN|nr:unnamed protein product [Spirodela intermedia]CAA6666037.1 unnamed protein product [Spirodela intermedia]